MKVITSINIYNFHLIISYLGDGIEIVPFKDLRSSFYKLSSDYVKSIDTKTTIIEVTPIHHNLVGLENSILKSISLKNSWSTEEENIRGSQVSFEYGSNSFYLLNTENEVQELVLSSSNNIFTKEKVRSRSLEKYETPAISNMKNYGLDIYLSIRGFGVAHLNKQKDELVFRTEDAQDLVFLKNHEVLVIADYKGLIFYRINEKKPFKSLELPNGDFPQEIKSFNSKILAKGKLGLYLVDTIDFKIKEVWNEKVGAFNSYYDMIFISSKNTLHMISNSENTIEYFKRNNNLEIDVKKYFR